MNSQEALRNIDNSYKYGFVTEIETERPDLLLGFDKGLLKRICRLCYVLLRDLLRHPIDTSYKILILVGIKKSK